MSNTIETALQNILAADHGLNEGDHLRLCNALKSAFESTKTIAKVEKERISATIDLEIKFSESDWYKLSQETRIDYVQRPGQHISSDYITIGSYHRAGVGVVLRTWNRSLSSVVASILKMHEGTGMIGTHKEGISRTWSYPSYIKEVTKRDILEKKARKKYGDLEEGKEESDHSYWRGDYAYARFIQDILHALGLHMC
jgi:hypothetical protein